MRSFEKSIKAFQEAVQLMPGELTARCVPLKLLI